jgi:hypothetical protein
MKEDRLDLLLHGLLEESLGETERAELNALLTADPQARRRYRRVMAIHAALIRNESAALPSFAAPASASRKIRRFPWRKLAVAALVPLAFTLIAITDMRAARQAMARAEVLQVTSAVWPTGSPGLEKGALPVRTPVELTSGLLEIGYPSGARVVVEGPCRFSLDSKEALTVLHGRASVHTPEGAEGFRIDTPGGRFIDRGTEFGVAVGSDGNRPVVLTEVFKGEIDVSTAGKSDIRLTRGEGRVVASDGKLLSSLDESPVRLSNSLHRAFVPTDAPTTNLALGKPVLSPGYCIRPHGSVFPPDKLTDGRLDDTGVPGDWSFWLAPDGEGGEFTVDLITPETISRIALQNTGNRGMDDRGTEAFEIFGSLDNKAFFPLTGGMLPRVTAADSGSSIPFHDFPFALAQVRYVKFVVTRHYRHEERPADHPCQGGGLNEIRIFPR